MNTIAYKISEVEKYVDVSELIGKTITIFNISADRGQITITCGDGSVYVMAHEQDCIGDVPIEGVRGNVNDLTGSPLISLIEFYSTDKDNYPFTWTFFKFVTIKGYAEIRWLSDSNEYYSEKDYSEKVSFKQIN